MSDYTSNKKEDAIKARLKGEENFFGEYSYLKSMWLNREEDCKLDYRD